MVYKKNETESQNESLEKYIFGLLIFAYILGVFIGCYFVFANSENVVFSKYIVSKSPFKIILYFTLAIIFKYSGILSSLICFLPAVMGLQNSVYYCLYIINKENNILSEIIMTTLKDTSLVLLLIIYITLIVYQIIKKRYNIKNDIRYFATYTTGAISILAIDYAIKIFIK